MEGRVSTFKKVLADFESRLQGADFVAIDTELTGVDLEGEPDTFDETGQQRLVKHCRIAERYQLIQVGLTVVGRSSSSSGGRNSDGKLACASYNLFAFPYVGPELAERGLREPGFFCQGSALQFNAQNNVNFNYWLREGIPYMNREDERRYLRASNGREDQHSIDEKVGLLRLWKALCSARLPFIVHCPADLFFLLAAFERRPLPRNDPRAMAMLIRQCSPKVFDTAHLHGTLGRFKRLGLSKFYEDAKAAYDEIRANGNGIPTVEFELVGQTQARYGKTDQDHLAHEAGYDSLLTAKLFSYLRAIAPTKVKENVNRLFLFKSVEYLDLDRAALEGQVGTSMFDLTRVTLLVAALDSETNSSDAPRLISEAGHLYKKIDSTSLLVVLRASGGAAVRKAAELAAKVHGVRHWVGFDEWKEAQAASASRNAASSSTYRVDEAYRASEVEQDAVQEASSSTNCRSIDAEESLRSGAALQLNEVGSHGRCRTSFRLMVASASGLLLLLLLLLARGKGQMSAMGARLLRRWRQR